ncbi:MAG: hemerythrin domain-containing protein [Phycisphaeraceae bacterium]|nr:hemerythrin domain-containing protein [Phycisphaeraceae bacterium]
MPEYVNPPLPRHEALAPFSRDHYAGLVQAKHLKEARDADSASQRQVVADFAEAWQREIQPHFNDEELLLPELISVADHRRLLDEHDRISEIVDRVLDKRHDDKPDGQKLHELGTALEAHIRWEERELFPRIQRSITAQRLADLESRTRRIEAQRPRNACRVQAR